MNALAAAQTAPTTLAEDLSALLKAGADPLRLAILRLLQHDSYGVLELCRILDTRQSGLSHHLKVLAGAGLVATRREGNSIFYRRGQPLGQSALEELQQALFRSADQLPLAAEVRERQAAVQAERAEQSQRFFAEHAEQFEQQQEQVADYSLYGPHCAELLAASFADKGGLAIEVGPGEGRFLAELAPRFDRVVALDNSREMLARAETSCRERELGNVELVHGDTRHHALSGLAADCVVANMVLHHTASPAEILFDLAGLLAPHGELYITELCHHDQSWTRDACGDLWLGFDPEDLTRWAAAAGLSEGQSVYLAQRNGFRVQIRQFLPTPSA